jgi:signal transduction histidine kinase
LKHGQARKIQISLQALPGRTELCISDDGRGFTPGHNNSHGLGLHAMKYRADTIGAELKIDSHPDRGTSITCALVKKV